MLVTDPKTYLWHNICLLMKCDSPTVDAVQLKTKIGRGTVQRIKEGQTSIGTDKLLAIAEAFDIELSKLLQPDLKPQTPSPAPLPAAASLAETLAQLGELLQRASPKTRAVVADLLGRYAQDPVNGKSIAQAIELLIDAEAGEKPGA